MTGGEIVPAVTAAASVAKKALDDKGDKKILQKMAADSPHMVSAADLYARRVAVRQAIKLRMIEPLARLVGVRGEYFDNQFPIDMAQRLSETPEEYLDSPSPSVAVPSLQALGYLFEEPDLKSMFLGLLATAADTRVSDRAHPSFAETIKQLSPAEAAPLLEVLTQANIPIVRISRLTEDKAHFHSQVDHVLGPVSATASAGQPLPMWVDNWTRLGLTDVDYGRRFAEDEWYSWVPSDPVYVDLAQADDRGAAGLRVDRGLLRITAFGRRFYSAVSYDGVALDHDGAPPDHNGGSPDPTIEELSAFQ